MSLQATLIQVDAGKYFPPDCVHSLNLSDLFEKQGNKSWTSSTYLTKGCENLNGQKMKESIAQIKQRIGSVLVPKSLYITESNSAHQISYFLADMLYEQFIAKNKPNEKMLVINIDQHFDYSNAGRQTRKSIDNICDFACGTWGCFLNDKTDYLALGCHSIPTRDETCTGADLITYLDMINNSPNMSLLSEAIENHKNFYITVDMDVLKGEYRTNWEEGKFEMQNLIDLLHRILTSIKDKGLNLIGADITGMPPKKVATKTPDGITPSCVQYIEEPDSTDLSYLRDVETVVKILLNGF